MIKLLGSAVLLLLIAGNGISQKAPIKFGEVSIEDLQMKSYAGDTSAAAVILCDYGYFNQHNLLFTRVIRIKILKKEGTSWGNHVYPVNSMSTIQGLTTNLIDGKLKQEKVKNESVFREKVTDGYYRLRVAMPNVREGSILDLMFTYPGFPQKWNFQEDIPVKYSELEIKSDNIKFRGNYFGSEKLYSSSPTKWIAKDMPSFREEPYINSPENYKTKLELDILEVGGGAFYKAFTTSWEEVSYLLNSSSDFGVALGISGYLNSLSKKISDVASSKFQMMTMAYDSVKTQIRWDENVSLVTSENSLAQIYKTRVGNSAEINLILIQLLRKLGIEAVPVIMSTRENGILSPLSPSIFKLNYVIARARIDGKTYLLDATEPYMPYYLLPLRCLNYQGRTVSDTQSEWVDIIPQKQNKKLVNYELELTAENDLRGSLSILNSDYAAYLMRKEYHKFTSNEEYVENLIKDKTGLLINKADFENIDSIHLPVNEKYNVIVNNKLVQNAANIYFYPMFFDQLIENPFRSAERKYPIDFAYNTDMTVISVIKIPGNYTISNLPAPVRLVLPGNSATYSYDVSLEGSVIKMTSRFVTNKTLFLQHEYTGLREFFNQMIKKQSEPIILKKSEK